MKLISKTLLYYLFVGLPLLLIAALISFYLIRYELKEGIDETLIKEKTRAEYLIKTFKEPHQLFLSIDSLSYILPVNLNKGKDIYFDSLIFDRAGQEIVNYRILNSYFTLNNSTYLISVSKTTLEEDELNEGLFSAFGLLVLFLMIGFFIANWLISKVLWKPFYKTLDSLNSYEIKVNEKIQFETVHTLEFNKLNEALNSMTEKIYIDFIQQKEFTENASHEMQTPLAVIKAHLDLLIQSPNLKETEMHQLQVIDNTTNKLASLNKALLLLSKIENNQFKDNSNINLKNIINKIVDNYLELINSKEIQLEINIKSGAEVNMNVTLADIFITNLFQNAIRHNIVGGEIRVNLSQNSLVISNSGAPLVISPNDLFKRFKKDDSSKDSIGLGLSIIKSILDSYGYSISYKYQNQLHVFEVLF